MAAPRGSRPALLGGTTTAGDAWTAVGYLLTPGRLVRGPAIEAYEAAFAERVGVRHGYSFVSGRVALFGILKALGVGPGDDVLLQVPTHIVVANAIRYTGARPVYVDCRPDSWNMDFDQAERRVTERTKALVLQHTFGIPADLDRALALCRGHDLDLVEDCVHALGATFDGRPVGSFGRAAFFSTEETKTISTTMGGVAVTDDETLAGSLAEFQRRCPWPSRWLVARYVLKLLVYHVLTGPRIHRWARPLYEATGKRQPLPGPTSAPEWRGERPARYEERLSNAQAALGLRQLERLDDNLAHRRRIAAIYAERLAGRGLGLPAAPAGADPAFVRYPVWSADRSAAVRALAAHTVPGVWFTSVLGESESPSFGGYRMGSCPTAEAAARDLVNLPTHPRVSPEDAERIAAAVPRGPAAE